MPRFFARHRFLVGSTLGLSVLTIGFFIWRTITVHTPLVAPIGLYPAGRIEQNIRVGMDAPHEVQIVFTNVTRPRDEVMRLVGGIHFSKGKTCDPRVCDVVVPLRWSISDATGKIIHSLEIDTHGMNGWSTQMFFRTAGKPFYLKSGRYRFFAEVTQNVLEFEGVTAQISLSQGGGKPSNWQGGVSFFGAILIASIIIPLIALLLTILIGLWIWEKRRLHQLEG